MTVPAIRLTSRVRLGVVLAAAMVIATFLAPMVTVQAHEGHGVVRSIPEDQGIVIGPPDEILVEFEGEVLEDQADLRLYTATGTEIETVQPPVVQGPVVRVGVTGAVAPGVYTAIYDVNTRTASGGFHRFDGTVRFTVRPAGCVSTIANVGPFTSISAPDFQTPPNRMSLAVADRNLQRVLWVTNGREVHRSSDGGCSWDMRMTLNSLPGVTSVSPGALVVDIVTIQNAPPGWAFVLVLDPTGDVGVVQPRLYRIETQGLPVQLGSGLEPVRIDPTVPLGCGHPQPCEFGISDAPLAALTDVPPFYFVSQPAFELGAAVVHRSDDLGATFVRGGELLIEGDLLTGPGLAVRPSAFATDIQQLGTVYVATGRTVHVSHNRGGTFEVAYQLPGTEGQVITHLAAGRSLRPDGGELRDVLAVLSADGIEQPAEALARLTAVGTVLERGPDISVEPLDGAAVHSIARTPSPGQSLVLPLRDGKTRPGVYEYESALDTMLDLDTEGVSPWLNAQWTSPLCTRWFGHDEERMYLIDADDGHAHAHGADDFCTQPDASTTDGVAVDLVDFPDPIDLVVDTDAVLQGITDLVQLEPGEPKSVGYTLSRNAEDVPVDIAFLFDTSGSMRDNVEAVRAQFAEIVQELQARQINAWFGLAEFADLTIRYRRLADIQPPGEGFATALARLQIKSGQDEPHRTALHQLATGEGLDRPSRGSAVAPGGQMNWRPEAVRIVIMASDEEIFDDPDGPSFAETVAALNAQQIHHVGMHIREELGQGGSTAAAADNPTAETVLLEQMREFSAATNAFAVRPIDCDGDGDTDVQVGEPLVCTLPNTISPGSPLATSGALARAIVDLVDSIEFLRTFTMHAPTPAGFTAKVQSAGLIGDRSPVHRLDVTLPQTPRWAVTYTCSPNVQGSRVTVPVGVALQQTTIATFPTTLVCGVPLVAAAAPAPAPAAAVAPIPPPVTPIPVNAPAPTAASANAFAQSAATSPAVGAAMAPQMEQQAQKAQIRDDDEYDAEYQFSAVRQRSPGPETTLALGFVMALGAGVAMSRQRAAAHQHARVNVRR